MKSASGTDLRLVAEIAESKPTKPRSSPVKQSKKRTSTKSPIPLAATPKVSLRCAVPKRAPKRVRCVSDVMRREVATCSRDTPINEVARLMWELDLGSVVVVDAAGAASGLITDRDALMAAYTQGEPLSSLNTAGAMAQKLVSVAETATLDEACALMRSNQVRRLPVVNVQGVLVGILGFSELLAEARKKGGLAPKTVFEALADLYLPPADLTSRRSSAH